MYIGTHLHFLHLDINKPLKLFSQTGMSFYTNSIFKHIHQKKCVLFVFGKIHTFLLLFFLFRNLMLHYIDELVCIFSKDIIAIIHTKLSNI